LRDELETLRQKLELVLGTEPGVIEQYERRKEEVRSVVPLFYASNARFHRTDLNLAQIASLSKKIEERNKQAAKIEKSIKVAKVSTPMPRDDSIRSTCYSNPSG